MHRFAPPLLLAFFAAVTVAAPVPPPPEESKSAPAKKPPTAEQIAQAIRNLGSQRFAVREQASKLLWEAGAAGEEALRQAARTNDAEVAQRAKAILEKFDWGLYPETPEAVAEVIERYQKGDGSARSNALRDLMRIRPIPFKTLRKLIAKEENADQRLDYFREMAGQTRQEVPDLLLRGELDTVEELLGICLAASVSESATDYAALLALRGKIDAGIARWEKERAVAQGADAERAAAVLVHLYRVKGDWASAQKAAEQSKSAELQEDVSWESRNWKALAARAPGNDRGGNQLGVRAAIYRLAGDRTKFEETIAELRKTAQEAGEDQATPRFAAEALLLNGQADDGIKLLVEKKNSLALAFDLLCARMKHKAAFDLVDDARRRDTEAGERNEIEIRRARMLYLLGEKDAAIQLFRKAAENIHEPSDLHLARILIKTEMRLGMREQAFEHAALALGNLVKIGQHDDHGVLFEPLFDKNSDSAQRWWKLLRTQLPKEEPPQIMQRLRDLMEGKATKERLAEAVKWMEASKEAKDRDPLSDGTSNTIHLTEPGVAQMAIAEVYRAAGDDAKAEEYYRKATEAGMTVTTPWIHHGDLLASRKRYREAAQQYHSAWEHNKTQPLPIYLEGRALLQAGDEREGKRLIELAHWIPLGNEYERCSLVEELGKRDWVEAARKEADFVLKTGWYRPANWQVGNVLSFTARLATQEKDYLKAADCYERGLLGCLRTGASFIEPTAYLSVPEAVRVNRARGLLDKGKVDEALQEAKANLEAMPGNIDLAIALVPDLDKLGRKKEADELYRQVRAAYEGLAKDYPTSGYARNSLAWLMALCRRDLDEARKQSEKAVELEPKNAGYIDTLAEVHFRQGNREKAIKLMKQCVALDAKNSYFQKQLERFRTKGFDSPTPQDDEEGDE